MERRIEFCDGQVSFVTFPFFSVEWSTMLYVILLSGDIIVRLFENFFT